LVSCESDGEKVYTLKSADRGYWLLVESINEGTVILSPDWSIYYANPRFEAMIKKAPPKTAGSPMLEYVHEEDREIFLPFRRLHGKSRNHEGVGMGLAICREIVGWHDSEITARSESGKGSTFIVTLPAEKKMR